MRIVDSGRNNTLTSTGSKMRLRDPSNSYKCYDSIATPSPVAPHDSLNRDRDCKSSNGSSRSNLQDHNHKSNNTKKKQNESNLHRPASLDSLVNSSDNGSSDEQIEGISDSDSISDLSHITGTTHAQVHRKSDLEDLKDSAPIHEPIIKAYLEKSHRKCDYKNCGYKKKDNSGCDEIKEEPIISTIVPSMQSPANGQVGGTMSSIKNRRSSIASSGSVGRMETIIEEPIEPKVSVKEILARFETLRENSEVTLTIFYLTKLIQMLMN